MTSIVIGSSAIKHHFPDFPRDPKDVDVISDNPVVRTELRNDVFWDDAMREYFGNDNRYATVDELYTLKVSHSYWDIHGTWQKHMHDVVWLAERGAQFDRDLYDIVLPVWKRLHGRKRTNLSQTKANFFSDAVVRIYDHDSIHDSVAYGERPMYERILRDGEEVAVSWDKFEALSLEEKFMLVREEVYATALERWVIPSNYRCSPRRAYADAMKKTITSLFKNDWALFIVLNYATLRDPDMDYVKHHKSQADRLIPLGV